eukprot:CAMPEP_0115858976 /NCGR_PEP_ID=MMETSP0287-20121206/16374_1 /TAXON_ID=412157 /ORGANISM="Chrysochromulina rotalis, Strain UIO044" /LENGTH=130 /DNA_ID=CAMNT_0003313255 /DNA_START=33 /DNA_END=425 /DNA_ORIENTATION=-
MSLAMGRTTHYTKFTKYSRFHPDNLAGRPEVPLPMNVAGPAIIAEVTALEKRTDPKISWGHRLASEAPFGTNETRTRLKCGVAAKVGGSWEKTITTEKGVSTLCSAIYGGSQVPMSCCEAADKGVGSLKR